MMSRKGRAMLSEGKVVLKNTAQLVLLYLRESASWRVFCNSIGAPTTIYKLQACSGSSNRRGNEGEEGNRENVRSMCNSKRGK